MRHFWVLAALVLGLSVGSPAFAQVGGGGGGCALATPTRMGCVMIDGTSVTMTNGIISAPTGGSGDVMGPASSTLDHLATFAGATGKIIKDSGLSFAAPGAIGGTTPAAGAFTTLSATSTPTFPLTHQKVLMGNASDAATETSLSQDIGCLDTGACTVTGLQTNKVDSGTPNNGDVLTWHTSGTPAWAPKAVALTGYTIGGTLPTCDAGAIGKQAYVTNGEATPAYLAAVSTTGSVVAPVFCNGTGWIYH